jgi:hypothetical protein
MRRVKTQEPGPRGSGHQSLRRILGEGRRSRPRLP